MTTGKEPLRGGRRQQALVGAVALAPPEGSVARVLEWVGDDRAHAAAALAAELAKPDPRRTLIDALRKQLG